MSVINKMLRDLDSRADSRGVPPGSGNGVSSVPAMPARLPARRRAAFRWWWLALPVVALAAAAVLWWTALARPGTRNDAVAASPAAGAAAVQAPAASASTAQAPPSAQPNAPTPLVEPAIPVVAPVVPAPKVVVQQQAPASAAMALVATPTVAPARMVAATAAPAPVPVGTASSRAEPVAAAAPPVGAEPRQVTLSWQDAAQDALSQAQRLWAGGARDAAIELAADALAGIERVHGADMSGAGSGVVLALLRELVRMEMVQGQHAAVLAVLKRYERVAAAQSDLWAVRANAAQRLGQHAESVQGYQMALRLRPAEPRWMLGAAVSLAAQGQTSAAAEMAEQARALSVVSPEVMAYLRQAGVVLRDR